MIPARLNLQMYKGATHNIDIAVVDREGAPYNIEGVITLQMFKRWRDEVLLAKVLTWTGTTLTGIIANDESDALEAGIYVYHLKQVIVEGEESIVNYIVKGSVAVQDVHTSYTVTLHDTVIIDELKATVTVGSTDFSAALDALRRVNVLLSSYCNVKDYGAKGDGSTDDTNAIQACINANKGNAVYFPTGNYKISDTIIIENTWDGSKYINNGIKIMGAGFGSTRITQTGLNKDGIIFRSQNHTLANNRFQNVEIKNISVDINNNNTTDFNTTAVRFIQCYRFKVTNFYSTSDARCITIQGCDRGYFDTIMCARRADTTNMSNWNGVDSCLVYVSDHLLSSGKWQPTWVMHFNKFLIELGWGNASTWSRYDTGIFLTRADGFFLENGYITGGRNSQLKLRPLHVGGDFTSTISKLSINNVYFDGNYSDRRLKNNIVIENTEGFTSPTVKLNITPGCFLGNCSEAAIYSRNTGLEEIMIGATIRQCDSVIDIEGNVTKTDVIFNGNHISMTANNTQPAINVGNIRTLKLNGATFSNLSHHLINIKGNLNTLHVANCTNYSNVRDINIESGVISKTIFKGNSSIRNIDQYNWAVDTQNNNYLWVDNNGKLRIKNSAPTSDIDGVIVGTQT